MKRILPFFLAVMLASCGNMDDFPSLDPIDREEAGTEPEKPVVDDKGTIDNNLTGDLGTKGLFALAIALDETPLTEAQEAVPTDINDPSYENFVENMYDADDEEYDVEIAYNGNSVTINGKPYASGTYTKVIQKKDTFCIDGANVTVHANKKYQYVLSGSSDNGSLRLYQNKKCSIKLNGLQLACKTGAPINLQSGKRAYIIVEGENSLSDCLRVDYTVKTSPDDGQIEDEKGVIFSEGKLAFSGNGLLTVNARGKHGIVSDDYVYLHPGPRLTINGAPGSDGIKTNDGIYIFGSVVNVNVNGAGAKGLNSEDVIDIRGGRTTIVSTAMAVNEDDDVSQPAAVKTDTELRITGGELLVSATGKGSKGIRAKRSYYQGGGTVKVLNGGSLTQDVAPDGAQCMALHVGTRSEGIGNAEINGGRLLARSFEGDGISCEKDVVVNGGVIESLGRGNAIRTGNLEVNGGYIYMRSDGGDALMAVGTAQIADGVVFADAESHAFSVAKENFKVNGGTVVGVGMHKSEAAAASTSTTLCNAITATEGTLVSVCDAMGYCHAAFQLPRDYSSVSAEVFVSAPTLAANGSFAFCHGGNLTLSDRGVALQGVFANGVNLTGQTIF